MTATPPDPDPTAVAVVGAAASGRPDAKRWVTLGIVLMATVIVVLDNTVLNVAIPTILQEFHTTLPSLEWVITGYSLTFATFLIIGGRLGRHLRPAARVRHRRRPVHRAARCSPRCRGTWPASCVGEALIEGIGASLMLPATLALLSNTFQGRGRAMAFAAWGAVAGSAAGLGPVVGGFLTTDFSWRWAFRINVIIAPLAIIGAMLFIAKSPSSAGKREPLDVPGAALIAVGMFLLVFALSEGGTYGWFTPIVGGRPSAGVQLWSATAPISIIPIVFAAIVRRALLVLPPRARPRASAPQPAVRVRPARAPHVPLRAADQRGLSMGQLGLSFALALFLQEGKHLSALAERPVGASLRPVHPGGRPDRGPSHQSHRHRPSVIRIGLVMQTDRR